MGGDAARDDLGVVEIIADSIESEQLHTKVFPPSLPDCFAVRST
jgi:hypothetical protein